VTARTPRLGRQGGGAAPGAAAEAGVGLPAARQRLKPGPDAAPRG
jgi:hypothetical protein